MFLIREVVIGQQVEDFNFKSNFLFIRFVFFIFYVITDSIGRYREFEDYEKGDELEFFL